jgi:hypothetical protein
MTPLKIGRTRARIEKIKLIIAALREHEMLRDDIGDLLGHSPSGTRKYIADLVAHGIIFIHRHVDKTAHTAGIPVFRLCQDAPKVETFIAHIEANRSCHIVGRSLDAITIAKQDPTRHFHVMRDDHPYAPRISRSKPPRPDPLVAALFGRMEVMA